MSDNGLAPSGRGPSFKTFWKKKFQKPLSFIPHDPDGKDKHKSAEINDAADEDEEPSGKPSARRQQVYRAQKLHRQRKADYVKHLEQEVANLRKLDADARKEKQKLENQNDMIREVLTSSGISVPSENPEFQHKKLQSSSIANAAVPVWVQFDENIGKDRIFVQPPSQLSSLVEAASPAASNITSSSYAGSCCSSIQEYFSVLDFILSLEFVCRDHTEHPAIYTTNSQIPQAEGHLLTTSSYVLGYAPLDTVPEPGAKWDMPYDEINRLIRFSEALDLQEEITPVQAWQTLRFLIGKELEPEMLKAMQAKLSEVVRCSGFGAVVKTEQFWAAVKEVTGRSATDLNLGV